ncbi:MULTISPECIES: hypothetical protein [Morganellaceae]|uniref:hypothetical protein n=2 Tax=Enterobacterales TaxID=91347 RepID=UPI00155DDC0A|nr:MULTISPECIES: hypothetical protein [Providencia]MCR4182083.1 hypothetical protein [Providencia vermicola]UPF36315.1 hypothetical protein MXW51_000375 [Providencia stuartii]UPG24118.1 hypothetical protein KDV75_000870 [Providencia stuartii]UPG24430.1 hypothetical protein KDV74_000870 [Providencia stuartii]UPG24742.1 hypothetical protein KDV66_000870 [Providencia stuartii]
MIKQIFRFIIGDRFIPLKNIDKNDFNRLSDFESVEWRVRVIQNGGIYKREWLKRLDNERKGIKTKPKIKPEKIKISRKDYEIISKITDAGYIILNFPAEDKIGRLSYIERILLDHLSNEIKIELLNSKLSLTNLDEIEYLHLAVFLDNMVIQ